MFGLRLGRGRAEEEQEERGDDGRRKKTQIEKEMKVIWSYNIKREYFKNIFTYILHN